jgi:hypothetical protein
MVIFTNPEISGSRSWARTRNTKALVDDQQDIEDGEHTEAYAKAEDSKSLFFVTNSCDSLMLKSPAAGTKVAPSHLRTPALLTVAATAAPKPPNRTRRCNTSRKCAKDTTGLPQYSPRRKQRGKVRIPFHVRVCSGWHEGHIR